jgi:Peptidase A4 family
MFGTGTTLQRFLNSRVRWGLAAAGLLVLGACGPGGGCGPSPPPPPGPTSLPTTFWAGYMQNSVGTPPGIPQTINYTGISGTFNVPNLTDSTGCTANTNINLQKSSTWVGIGGDTNQDQNLIQAGVQADLTPTGCTHIWAFYELLPAGPVTTNLAVSPGDRISVQIREVLPALNPACSGSPQCWAIYMNNLTTAGTFSTTVPYLSHHSSAEAILERTNGVSNPGPVLPHTSNIVFDTVQYTTTAPIVGPPLWRSFFFTPQGAIVYNVVMNNVSGSQSGTAIPSPQDSDGDGFQVADGTTPPAAPSS